MYGLNIDPRNPSGYPSAAELRQLGVELVRYTFKEATTAPRPDPAVVRFYRFQLKELVDGGLRALVILDHETHPNQPAFNAPQEAWADYIVRFAAHAAEIAKVLAVWCPTFQIWQAPDAPLTEAQRTTTLPEAVFGQLLHHTTQAIKRVDTKLQVIAGGLVSGKVDWLERVTRSLGGSLPVDAVALHLYTQRPDPDWPSPEWGTGYSGDLLSAYRQITNLPLWLTEVGVDTSDEALQADYLRRFYRTITTKFAAEVEQVFWFCYSDVMAYPFGLVNSQGRPKAVYQAYRETATAALATVGIAAVPAAATVSLNRLHTIARYLEQNIVFAERDQTLQRQMEQELRGNWQRLPRADIWRLMNQMLTGSPHLITQPEIETLNALQGEKDLYGVLRSLVLATHQKTGALTARIGVHVRISAETEANAITNSQAVLRALSYLLPGRRLVVMDAVKAMADLAKLQAPDIFETNIYGQHRNGLIDNHAWNLQRVARTIRDQGLQDRLMLIMRLDGPDEGANVNVFNGQSLQRYELAIFKFIRYLETVLSDVPFKLVLGNEPDLPHERQWSDPNLNPRTFVVEQFGPALGTFMKRLARRRPDVTFICPALSANLKHEQLPYYTAFFGTERPDNLVPALHGYAGDITRLADGQQNLLEQQTQHLRAQGKFKHISGTELGSNQRFVDGEALSDKGRFDDVVLWLLLSTNHQAPPGQDNNWSFRINPEQDDPGAQELSHIVNRSQARIIRNIQERSGATLQILQGRVVPPPPASLQLTASHNTVQQGAENLRQALDGRPETRWSSRTAQRPGMWVELDLHETRQVRGLTLQSARSPRDYPRGYRVLLSTDRSRWVEIARHPQNQGELAVIFGPQAARYLRVEQTGWADSWWWSIHELTVDFTTKLALRSSHNNVQQGGDNLLQAIDGRPETRWSSQAVQRPGMWVEIDIGKVRSVSGLVLDSARSPLDYPRGYVVQVSTDRQAWREVARKPDNEEMLDVTFKPTSARYLRVEQTGQADSWWWSIHEVIIK